MGSTISMLDKLLQRFAPPEETIATLSGRRDEILKIANRYPGTLNTYWVGSVAHKTANYNADADAGMVLDRRSYPELGPDGSNEGPIVIVGDVRAFVTKELKPDHADVRFRETKRGMKITYNEPLANGDDPTVDLIVTLNRKGQGLWIPNLEFERWDKSDPECHTRLMGDEPGTLRRTRRRVVRLTKGWNKQYSEPCLSSFNITALALECIEEGMGIATGLAAFFSHAASELPNRLTPDPAGVSPAIKLLTDRDTAVNRLRQARDWMNTALDRDDDEKAVQDALSHVFYKYVEPPLGSRSKAGLAKSLKYGNSGVGIGSGLTASPATAPIKTTRAFGDRHQGHSSTHA